MKNRSKSARHNKSQKPYPEFPLTPHPTGRWCKRIRGHLFYFGKIDDPESALERLNREWPYLREGRTPPPVDVGDGCTIMLLCNSFLTAKLSRLKSGDLSHRTFLDYQRGTDQLIEYFGKHRRVDDLGPHDFQRFREWLAESGGTVSLKNRIGLARIAFKFAFDSELIEKPVRYGQAFGKPSAKAIRKARNAAGPKLFEADEIRSILNAADPVLKAMTLLGVNCGFGNTDCASVPVSAVDFQNQWISFPRPKTEIPRRVPLWSETTEALRTAIELRPKPKDSVDSDLCFVTGHGRRWVRVQEKKSEKGKFVPMDAISPKFGKILRKLNINGRKGVSFYTLRHCFQTIGGEAKDPDAVSSIMGHVDSSMASLYRERISDERLHAVVNVVRAWLFPAEAQGFVESDQATFEFGDGAMIR